MLLSTNDARLIEQYKEARDSYNPIAYRINYFMIQKEYDKIMIAIDNYWSNDGDTQSFWRTQINSRLVGSIIRTKINP